eukprot:TRINITY_DN53980_c0_g1_i1.p1 TRINITY_DN53980_c0_g1~~TRINITY_DN53980_c0_g1_i1.p1  ORF type:complete len:626 (+),score=111.09 TRINITY_DN53980_c0_g1_i1:68-1879(+)
MARGGAEALALSTDSEPPTRFAAATESEFERLMQDTPETVKQVDESPLLRVPAAGSAALSQAAAATFVAPPPLPDSPLESPAAMSMQGAAAAASAGSLESPVRSLGLGLPEPREGAAESRTPTMAAGPPAARVTSHIESVGVSEGDSMTSRTVHVEGHVDDWARVHLSSRLDDIAREMKRSVEHEFALAERALSSRYEAYLHAEKMKAEAAACQQHAVIEGLERERRRLLERVDSQQRQLKGSLLLVQRTRRGLTGRCALARTLAAWRSVATGEKADRWQQVLTERIDCKRLLGYAVGTWRRHVQAAWKERLVAHERAAADTVRAKIFEQMEMERSCMAKELERLKAQLADESRQRAQLQDNLKRVFMRGVCALNFEAMSLLSDGSGANGGVPGADSRPFEVADSSSGAAFAAMAAMSSPSAAVPAVASGAPVAPGTENASCGVATAAASASDFPVSSSAAPAHQSAIAATTQPSARDGELQPRPAPTPDPLPFVSYVGPADADPNSAARGAQASSSRTCNGGGAANSRYSVGSAAGGHNVGPTVERTSDPSELQRPQQPKGLRWQVATAPRTSGGSRLGMSGTSGAATAAATATFVASAAVH